MEIPEGGVAPERVSRLYELTGISNNNPNNTSKFINQGLKSCTKRANVEDASGLSAYDRAQLLKSTVNGLMVPGLRAEGFGSLKDPQVSGALKEDISVWYQKPGSEERKQVFGISVTPENYQRIDANPAKTVDNLVAYFENPQGQ